MAITVDSITQSIKRRLDELEPGQEYNRLLAALDCLDDPVAELDLARLTKAARIRDELVEREDEYRAEFERWFADLHFFLVVDAPGYLVAKTNVETEIRDWVTYIERAQRVVGDVRSLLGAESSDDEVEVGASEIANAGGSGK